MKFFDYLVAFLTGMIAFIGTNIVYSWGYSRGVKDHFNKKCIVHVLPNGDLMVIDAKEVKTNTTTNNFVVE